jgi:hypothetical protein
MKLRERRLREVESCVVLKEEVSVLYVDAARPENGKYKSSGTPISSLNGKFKREDKQTGSNAKSLQVLLLPLVLFKSIVR